MTTKKLIAVGEMAGDGQLSFTFHSSKNEVCVSILHSKSELHSLTFWIDKGEFEFLVSNLSKELFEMNLISTGGIANA